MELERLLEFAKSDKQRMYIQAAIDAGGIRPAARQLDCNMSTVRDSINLVKLYAAREGVAPEAGLTHQTAAGFATKRVSTLYKDDGSIGAQWHIQEQDKQAQLEALLAVLDRYEWKPAPKINHEGGDIEDLCTLYTLTDYHVGMYAESEIGGDDWNSEIASNCAINAISQMITGSPDSHQAILNLQGDFFHYDNLEGTTLTSGHVLDRSSGIDRMIDAGIHIVNKAIHLLLNKHKNVHVIICEGNHDLIGSRWLRRVVEATWKDNPQLTLDKVSFPYYAYLHGNVLLGFHHGHKKKNIDLPALFASEPKYRELWGKSTVTYIHSGHYHHAEKNIDEIKGAIVERHPTLSARDSYAARGGYTSWRAANAITYHRVHGEQTRVTVTPIAA